MSDFIRAVPSEGRWAAIYVSSTCGPKQNGGSPDSDEGEIRAMLLLRYFIII